MNNTKLDFMHSTGEILDNVCIDCSNCLKHPCVECEDCPVGRLKILYKKELKKIEVKNENQNKQE